MTAQAQTCYTLVCDECREAVYEADEGCPYHFESIEPLRHEATEYGEWSQDGERDLCPACTAAASCAADGHVPALDVGGDYCDRCEAKL